MTLLSGLYSGLRQRRHLAVAAGLLALWIQALAFNIPMPVLATALCRDGSAAGIQTADENSPGRKSPAGNPASDGKTSTPCPLCQSLQILGSTPLPRTVDLASVVLSPIWLEWPTSDRPFATEAIATGFLSRAPPTA